MVITSSTRNRVGGKTSRGFESHLLRHKKNHPNGWFFLFVYINVAEYFSDFLYIQIFPETNSVQILSNFVYTGISRSSQAHTFAIRMRIDAQILSFDNKFIPINRKIAVVCLESLSYFSIPCDAVGKDSAMKRTAIHLLTTVLMSSLLCSLYPASAAQPVAQIEDQLYATLADAVAAAKSGDEIVLLSDCSLTQSVTLPSGVSLDGQQYQLTFANNASLTALGDCTLCNLSVEISRNALSSPPIVLSGSETQYTLDNLVIHCLNSSRPPRSTALVTFSASDSTLTATNCRWTSALNQTTGLLVTGDCSDSTITLNQVQIQIDPAASVPLNCYGILTQASGAPALKMDGCILDTPTAGLGVSKTQEQLDAILTDCTVQSGNALSISGLDGTYQLSDCTLSDRQTDLSSGVGLLYLHSTAQDNRISITDSDLLSGSEANTPCVFSIQNSQNEISLNDHTAIQIQSDTLDLVHMYEQLCEESPVSADDSVDLSAFPVTWYNADGVLDNASTSLSAAAPLWQASDTITLRGALAGAIDLQVPVTLLGDQASFSGSLAIRAPGTVVHGLDLSNSTVDCAAGCDLSYNYWGAQSIPSDAITSPYYLDADLHQLHYAGVPDAQVQDEISQFIDEVQDLLSAALPNSTLPQFDPVTAGDALSTSADDLRALCQRISQTTTAAQRAAVLSASPALAEQMTDAWRVYWSGVGINAADSVVELSPQLQPSGSESLRASITQNVAAQQAVCGIALDGTAIDPDTVIFLHSTLTNWRFDTANRVQSLTFQTGLRTAQGTDMAGDGIYRLPVPVQDCETVHATVNGVAVPVTREISPDGYVYVTLSQCGTVELSTYAPDQPDIPDEPEEPENPGGSDTSDPTGPETYTISLRAGSHGSLRLRTGSEAAEGDTVRITVTPDDGYELDTLDVVDARGRSLDYKLSQEDLRFTMSASNVRVTARFSRIQTVQPADEAASENTLVNDLSDGAWYTDDVTAVLTRGWMSPLLIGQFCPDLPTTRGDLITALYRMAGQPVATAPAFTDIPPDSAYYAASIWARASGIAVGEPDGRFRPYDTVTREECVSLLYRFRGSPSIEQTTLPFSDAATVSSWAQAAMGWAYQTGILYGNTEGTCTPLAAVTRAETAALLLRLLP